MIIEKKLGMARTVRGRILIMSLLMTLAMIISVVFSVVIQYNQTCKSIESALRDNLSSTVGLVQNSIDSLKILVNDHAYDYEFVSGTDEQKEQHAKAVAAFDEDVAEIVYMDSSGKCYGGDIPNEVKTALASNSLVITSPESSDGYFYIAVKTSDGNALCSHMSAKKLSKVLSDSAKDAFLLAADGRVIASSGLSESLDFSAYVQTSTKGKLYSSIFDENNKCYAAALLENGDDWTLLVINDVSYSYMGIVMIFWISVVMVIIAAGVVISANFYFKKTVTRPLGKIREKILDMSKGIISGPPVDHNANDELGLLSNAVNRMSVYNNSIISDIKHTAEEIAAENLCVKPNGQYSGDYIPVKEALEKIVSSIRNIVENIEEAGSQVSSGSEEMSRNSSVLSSIAEEEAVTVTQVNDKLNAVYDEISNNAKVSCVQANNTSRECLELVTEGNEKMGDMLSAMNEINGASSKIANIIKTIQDISEQTNILSINASIEAARVGAAGKGFAVVAGDVGKLADKTAQAAKSTTALIKTAIQSVRNGTVIANETAETLGKIVEKTEATSKVVENIAEASTKQAESVKDVLEGMDNISTVVNQINVSAKQCADSSEELAKQSVMLHDTVNRFVLEEKAPKSTHSAPIAQVKPDAPKAAAPVKAEKKPAEKAPKKPAEITSGKTAKPKKPTEIKLDEPVEKKETKVSAPKENPVEKPQSEPAVKKQEKKKAAPEKTEVTAPKPTVKLDENPLPTTPPQQNTQPISKATMQPVKRTINLDSNKY